MTSVRWRLRFAQRAVHFGDQFVPLLVFFGDGLVHEFVGHVIRTVTAQDLGELIPHVDQVLLRFLGIEKRVGLRVALKHRIEIVGADDMQIHDRPQFVFASPVERLREQFPCLGKPVALLVPELHLVDGNAHEVETQFGQTPEIVLLNVIAAGLAALVVLRQPMAQIRSPFDAEVVGSASLAARKAAYGSQQKGQ